MKTIHKQYNYHVKNYEFVAKTSLLELELMLQIITSLSPVMSFPQYRKKKTIKSVSVFRRLLSDLVIAPPRVWLSWAHADTFWSFFTWRFLSLLMWLRLDKLQLLNKNHPKRTSVLPTTKGGLGTVSQDLCGRESSPLGLLSRGTVPWKVPPADPTLGFIPRWLRAHGPSPNPHTALLLFVPVGFWPRLLPSWVEAQPKSHLNFIYLVFCSIVCGILVPWPGIEPEPSALEGRVLTTGLPGKSPQVTS